MAADDKSPQDSVTVDSESVDITPSDVDAVPTDWATLVDI